MVVQPSITGGTQIDFLRYAPPQKLTGTSFSRVTELQHWRSNLISMNGSMYLQGWRFVPLFREVIHATWSWVYSLLEGCKLISGSSFFHCCREKSPILEVKAFFSGGIHFNFWRWESPKMKIDTWRNLGWPLNQWRYESKYLKWKPPSMEVKTSSSGVVNLWQCRLVAPGIGFQICSSGVMHLYCLRFYPPELKVFMSVLTRKKINCGRYILP